jgi:hypothetical protein
LALSDVVIVSERFPQRYTGAADLRSALRRMAARGPPPPPRSAPAASWPAPPGA